MPCGARTSGTSPSVRALLTVVEAPSWEHISYRFGVPLTRTLPVEPVGVSTPDASDLNRRVEW